MRFISSYNERKKQVAERPQGCANGGEEAPETLGERSGSTDARRYPAAQGDHHHTRSHLEYRGGYPTAQDIHLHRRSHLEYGGGSGYFALLSDEVF